MFKFLFLYSKVTLTMKTVHELGTRVYEIAQACLEGSIGPYQAVEAIDEVIGGITRVDFKTGVKLKFSNNREMYAIDSRGIPRKAYELIEALAVLGYQRAQQNGSLRPGEVHINERASTKHHRAGIEAIASRWVA